MTRPKIEPTEMNIWGRRAEIIQESRENFLLTEALKRGKEGSPWKNRRSSTIPGVKVIKTYTTNRNDLYAEYLKLKSLTSTFADSHLCDIKPDFSFLDYVKLVKTDLMTSQFQIFRNAVRIHMRHWNKIHPFLQLVLQLNEN